jgi:aspartate/methionine/tyrosine aminotransferase
LLDHGADRAAFKQGFQIVLNVVDIEAETAGGQTVDRFFGKTLRGTLIKDATDFSMYLLAEANVATVTGDAFGNPDCIRFSYATSEELLIEAMRRIKEVIA